MATKSVNGKVLTLPDKLIADANQQIDAAKQRIAALRKAIKSFEDLKHIPEYATQSREPKAGQQHSV